ncbi:hypothetical protein ABT001_35205 [Streptomyces sp. NPDC002793]|uniref:hypothetical protein n=1 Tax=Streptomyces sp. NPDC002793 TaxID=3154432 RepID=UPI00331BD8B7
MKTRETVCEGYRRALEAHLASRKATVVDPMIQEVRQRRQGTVLRCRDQLDGRGTRLRTGRSWQQRPPAVVNHRPDSRRERDRDVRYDPETGILHLQPATPDHRTQLNLHQQDIIAKINQSVGPDSVRHLHIRTSSALSTSRAAAPDLRSGRDQTPRLET